LRTWPGEARGGPKRAFFCKNPLFGGFGSRGPRGLQTVPGQGVASRGPGRPVREAGFPRRGGNGRPVGGATARRERAEAAGGCALGDKTKTLDDGYPSSLLIFFGWNAELTPTCTLPRLVTRPGPRAARALYVPSGGAPLHPLRGLPRSWADLGSQTPTRPGTGPRREGLM